MTQRINSVQHHTRTFKGDIWVGRLAAASIVSVRQLALGLSAGSQGSNSTAIYYTHRGGSAGDYVGGCATVYVRGRRPTHFTIVRVAHTSIMYTHSSDGSRNHMYQICKARAGWDSGFIYTRGWRATHILPGSNAQCWGGRARVPSS